MAARQVTIDELQGLSGMSLGYSGLRTVSQSQVLAFVEATGAPNHGVGGRVPGGPEASGFLLLSLVPVLLHDVVEITGAAMGVNYGANRVRFLNPVPADTRVRAEVVVSDVTDIDRGVQITFTVTIHSESEVRLCALAEVVFRYYRSAPEER